MNKMVIGYVLRHKVSGKFAPVGMSGPDCWTEKPSKFYKTPNVILGRLKVLKNLDNISPEYREWLVDCEIVPVEISNAGKSISMLFNLDSFS